MRAPEPTHTAAQRQLLAEVTESGLHVVHHAGDDELPAYATTVGLWENFGQPEVVVFGLPPEVGEELLQAIADQNDEGVTFLPGSRHQGLLEGYPVRFLVLGAAARERLCAVARWAYGGEEFPAVQLVWPDPQGRWPWDPATREGYRKGQPVFGEREVEGG